MSLDRLEGAAGWARDAQAFAQCGRSLGSGAQRRGDRFADQIQVARVDRRPQIEAIARIKREPFGKLGGETGWRPDEEWRRACSKRCELVSALQGLALRTTQDRHRGFD